MRFLHVEVRQFFLADVGGKGFQEACRFNLLVRVLFILPAFPLYKVELARLASVALTST